MDRRLTLLVMLLGSASAARAADAVSWAAVTSVGAYGPVAGAGDVDQDGFDDLLASSYAIHGVVLYFGDPAWALGDRFTLLSDPSADLSFGTSVAGLGDVDGDGYPDVGVSAPSGGAGRVCTYSGGPDGPVSAEGSCVEGEADGDAFGSILKSAQDVDGDGVADVLASAPDASGGAGEILVYPGGTLPLAAPAVRNGEPAERFGTFADAAGDVNGDGYADVIAAGDPGPIRLYAGSASGLESAALEELDDGESVALLSAAGDLDADGFDDVAFALLTEADPVRFARGGSAGFGDPTPLGEGFCWYCGPRSMAPAGDVNGDGADDLLLGALGLRGAVYAGSEAGSPFAPVIYLYVGGGYEHLGDYSAAAGDLNGDGHKDFALSRYESTYVLGTLIYDGWPADHGDADLDGVNVEEDCDDLDPSVGAPLSGYVDDDRDGYGGSDPVLVACEIPAPYVITGGDCDDARPDVHPGASEVVADEVDQDCDTTELCYCDGDHDGYRRADDDTRTSFDLDCDDPGEAVPSLPSGDCDDMDDAAYPGAEEMAGDGIDQDCDGIDAGGPAETGTADTATESEPPDSTGGAGDETDGTKPEPGGCGCQGHSAGSVGSGWLALVATALGFRRRGRFAG